MSTPTPYDPVRPRDFQSDCEECNSQYIEQLTTGIWRGPSHSGSPSCESGSLASGGHRAHCSCDTCF